MKYLPKSKLGAVIAVLYLSITGYFLWNFAFGGGGAHGEAGTSFIYVFVLTLPLSAVVMAFAIFLKGAQPNNLVEFLFIAAFAACAVVNAVSIYLVAAFVSRLSGDYFKRRKEKDLP